MQQAYQKGTLAREAVDLLQRKANLGWTTRDHTAVYVPIYVIGTRATLFDGSPLNNTDISNKIRTADGWKSTINSK